MTPESPQTPPSPIITVWIQLMERRRFIAGVTVLLLILGGIQLLLRPSAPFQYLTILEIGSAAELDALTESKLTSAIIPSILANDARTKKYARARYHVEVERNKNVISLISYGSAEQEQDITAIQTSIMNVVLADHQELFAAKIGEIDTRIQGLRQELTILQRQAALFPLEYERLEQTTALVERQADDIRARLGDTQRHRTTVAQAEAQRRGSQESLAASLLLLDADIQHNQERLQSLEERLVSGIAQEREQIQKREFENAKSQQNTQDGIAQLEREQEALQTTQVALSPSRGLQQPQRGALSVLILFGVLGVFLGILTALFLSFLDRVSRVQGTAIGKQSPPPLPPLPPRVPPQPPSLPQPPTPYHPVHSENRENHHPPLHAWHQLD